MKYPEHYPTQTGFDPESAASKSFRYAWEGPMTDDSFKLAKTLKHSASAIEHEGGLCHIGYACHEAAHRLAETIRILKTDAPGYEQLNALHKLHGGNSLQNETSAGTDASEKTL